MTPCRSPERLEALLQPLSTRRLAAGNDVDLSFDNAVHVPKPAKHLVGSRYPRSLDARSAAERIAFAVSPS